MVLETGDPLDRPPMRRPPGIAVDPTAELPEITASARSRDELAVLQQPLDAERAREVVNAFFAAVVAEAPDRLASLLTDDARIMSSRRGRRELAAVIWHKRLDKLDYGSVSGQLLYKRSDVELYRATELDALHPSRPLPLRGQGDDVLVVVPMASTKAGSDRLFGDEIVFLLTRRGETYKIEEIFEDFRLP